MRECDGDALVELLEEWFLVHDKPPHGLLTVLRRAGLELVDCEEPQQLVTGAELDDALLDSAQEVPELRFLDDGFWEAT